MKNKNEYIIQNDYALIIINSPKFGQHFAKIDNEDIEKVKNHKWGIANGANTTYVRTHINLKTVSLHKFITNCPKGYEVDHINHDGLDNRKSNLRICTRKENIDNTSNGRYGYIYYAFAWKKWVYKTGNKRLLFDSKVDAIIEQRKYTDSIKTKKYPSAISHRGVDSLLKN